MVEKLFHEALAVPSGQRPAFLDTACAGDEDLRLAVEELLQHAAEDEASDKFLVSPLAQAVAQLRPNLPTVVQRPDERGGAHVPDWPAIPGYELLAELGRGGMGVVYKARQTSLSRIVALKMLLPAAGPELLARFRAEAEVLARLQHPNIITIYDIGEQQGRPYFTMEYVAGPSLSRLAEGRPQEIVGSARLLEALARTIHVVHQQGILHRDLKPANILLRRMSDTPTPNNKSAGDLSNVEPRLGDFDFKITDFGLAKDQATAGNLTQTDVTMGTPCYMAPEQARGSGVGQAADVYALGSILYELLTGRPPFQGGTAAETLDQLRDEEPLSPARLRPKLPRDIVTICLKCLEKAPRNRYASALELAEDLRRFQAGEPIRARPIGILGRSIRWCRRRPLVAGLLLVTTLLAVGLVATILIYNARLQEALVRVEKLAENRREHIVQLNVSIGVTALDEGDAFTALLRFTEALSLDEGHGNHERSLRTRIAVALSTCPRLLHMGTFEGRVLCTRWNADGGWLALLGPGPQLQVYEALTGRPVGPALPMDQEPLVGAISLDGRLLATITPDGVARVWNLALGSSKQLPVKGTPAIRRVVFHPESRVLISEHDGAVIRSWDLADWEPVPNISSSGPARRYSVLSDNARWMFTQDTAQVGQVWDTATGQAVGGPPMLGLAVRLAAVSSDGSRVAVLAPDGLLQVWDVAQSRRFGHPIRPGSAVSQVLFSPDGKRVLTLDIDRGIQVWRVQTGTLVATLAPHDSTIKNVRFDLAGGQVVTTSAAGAVKVWDAETGRPLTPPLKHGGPGALVAFHAEGKRVAILSRTGLLSSWELPAGPHKHAEPDPETRPVAELITLAQLLAASRIDERQQVHLLERDLVGACWKSLAPTGALPGTGG
jgi:WD40 repeat protein/tRNA A-37 threonylcarbamoyl transferase component Bud32